VETVTEENESKLVRTQDNLSELRVCIESVFNKLGCNSSGDAGGRVDASLQITDSNAMVFLGIIEQRANELLQLRNIQQAQHRAAALQSEEDDVADDEIQPSRARSEVAGGKPTRIQFIGQGPSVPFGQTNLQALIGQLPSTGDTFGNEGYDDTEDDRVLTQDELRIQTEQRMAAKDESKRDLKRTKSKKKKE